MRPKAAAFRESQVGRTLRVLTLRRDPGTDPDFTPALSSNYARVRLPGIHGANAFRDVRACYTEASQLVAAL